MERNKVETSDLSSSLHVSDVFVTSYYQQFHL